MTALVLPPKFPHPTVTRDNCDPADPYQAFLWMLVQWPVPRANPLWIPRVFWQLFSKRLWDLGVRPAAEPAPVSLESPPQKFVHEFPVRENCDPTNPYEVFLWMMAGMPGIRQGAPLLLGIADLQIISRMLWDLGARPVHEPMLKYRRPSALTDGDWLTSPGVWVPVGEDFPPPPVFRNAAVGPR